MRPAETMVSVSHNYMGHNYIPTRPAETMVSVSHNYIGNNYVPTRPAETMVSVSPACSHWRNVRSFAKNVFGSILPKWYKCTKVVNNQTSYTDIYYFLCLFYLCLVIVIVVNNQISNTDEAMAM